jgi:hypothetical protein
MVATLVILQLGNNHAHVELYDDLKIRKRTFDVNQKNSKKM